ncbi:hypothetical protein Q7P37_005553 [Cladosporium fusiforme]
MGRTYMRNRLHLGGKYSDLTVTCNYRQWAVHKAILCSRSGFFDGACSGRFREADTGVIDLSEDDEDAVDQMIHCKSTHSTMQDALATYLQQLAEQRRRLPKKFNISQIEDPLLSQAGYCAPEPQVASPVSPPDSAISINTDVSQFKNKTKSPRSPRSPARNRQQQSPYESEASSDYESYDEDEEVGEEESHLLMHTRVYALAEKYDIPCLKQLAQSKFEMAMACYYDSSEFADAIEEVYCSTIDSDRGLRDVVLQAFRSHPALATTQDVYAVIKDTPTLALELFKVEKGLPI